jgi:putative membrane protein
MKTNFSTPVFSILATLLLAIPCARAQTPVAASDVNFLRAAAENGMTEVKLGELAAKQGTTEDLKEFGQMMVKDHGAINDHLKTLAAAKGVVLPTELDAKHQALVDKTAALPGSEFDDTYLMDTVKGHQKDITAYKAESADTQDMEIKDFVDKTLPLVETHLRMAGGLSKTGMTK